MHSQVFRTGLAYMVQIIYSAFQLIVSAQKVTVLAKKDWLSIE